MRIFKNRGDIYFSNTNKEKSKEQKILIVSLVVIVCFTIVFLFAVAAQNDFSVKKFFEPENLSTTQSNESTTAALPTVSGKTNFIVTVSEDSTLLFVELVQVDMDNVSYKVCALKPSTEYDGSTLGYIYSHSGAQNVKTAVESMMSAEFDYYIDFEKEQFIEYFDSLGSVNYALASDIKYKDSDSKITYSLRLKAGEQDFKGSQTVNLVRYYIEKKNNASAANDILLNALLQQNNSENYENKDEFFQNLVTNANTNITVKNYSAAADKIEVLCSSQSSVGVYNAEVKYKKNKITKKSLQSAKGYFAK